MQFLLTFMLGGLVSFLTTLAITKRPKRIVLSSDDGCWLDIEKHSIPDELFVRETMSLTEEILITDGISVDCTRSLKFDNRGKLIMYYPMNRVTHWRPMPEPPGVKNE